MIVTAPSDNTEQKRFLGYDWSNRKGSEGIQIHTPGGMLYNEHDRNAAGTIAAAIRFRFSDDAVLNLDEDKKPYCTLANLSDMIDFSRLSFNKAIKLTPDKKIEINSKYPLVRLEELVTIIRGVTFDKKYQTQEKTKNIVLTADNITLEGQFEIIKEIFVSDMISFDKEKQLRKNDCFMCFSSGSKQHVGKIAFIKENQSYYAGGFMGILRVFDKNLLPQFLYETLNTERMRDAVRSQSSGTNIQNLSNKIAEFQIPLPPLPIQRKIVAECEKVDEEYNTSRMSIEEDKKKIAQVFERLEVITNVRGVVTFRLSNTAVFDISIGKRVLNSEVSPQYSIPVYSANVFEPFGMIDKLLIQDFSKSSVLWGIDGDWMVNIVDTGIPFYPTDHCGVLRIKTDDILPKYMAYLLEKEGKKAGFSRSYRASIDRIKSLSVQVAPIEEQRKAIKEIETYESEIAAAKAVMAACTEKKKMILDKWL